MLLNREEYFRFESDLQATICKPFKGMQYELINLPEIIIFWFYY